MARGGSAGASSPPPRAAGTPSRRSHHTRTPVLPRPVGRGWSSPPAPGKALSSERQRPNFLGVSLIRMYHNTRSAPSGSPVFSPCIGDVLHTLTMPAPFPVAWQVSCGLRAQAAASSPIWARRQARGPIFHALARQKACRIIEGHLMPDHVHMCIEIPPKYAGASVIGSPQRQECHCYRPAVCGTGSQLRGAQLVGARLCGLHRWL